MFKLGNRSNYETDEYNSVTIASADEDDNTKINIDIPEWGKSGIMTMYFKGTASCEEGLPTGSI